MEQHLRKLNQKQMYTITKQKTDIQTMFEKSMKSNKQKSILPKTQNQP